MRRLKKICLMLCFMLFSSFLNNSVFASEKKFYSELENKMLESKKETECDDKPVKDKKDAILDESEKKFYSELENKMLESTKETECDDKPVKDKKDAILDESEKKFFQDIIFSFKSEKSSLRNLLFFVKFLEKEILRRFYNKIYNTKIVYTNGQVNLIIRHVIEVEKEKYEEYVEKKDSFNTKMDEFYTKFEEAYFDEDIVNIYDVNKYNINLHNINFIRDLIHVVEELKKKLLKQKNTYEVEYITERDFEIEKKEIFCSKNISSYITRSNVPDKEYFLRNINRDIFIDEFDEGISYDLNIDYKDIGECMHRKEFSLKGVEVVLSGEQVSPFFREIFAKTLVRLINIYLQTKKYWKNAKIDSYLSNVKVGNADNTICYFYFATPKDFDSNNIKIEYSSSDNAFDRINKIKEEQAKKDEDLEDLHRLISEMIRNIRYIILPEKYLFPKENGKCLSKKDEYELKYYSNLAYCEFKRMFFNAYKKELGKYKEKDLPLLPKITDSYIKKQFEIFKKQVENLNSSVNKVCPYSHLRGKSFFERYKLDKEREDFFEEYKREKEKNDIDDGKEETNSLKDEIKKDNNYKNIKLKHIIFTLKNKKDDSEFKEDSFEYLRLFVKIFLKQYVCDDLDWYTIITENASNQRVIINVICEAEKAQDVVNILKEKLDSLMERYILKYNAQYRHYLLKEGSIEKKLALFLEGHKGIDIKSFRKSLKNLEVGFEIKDIKTNA